MAYVVVAKLNNTAWFSHIVYYDCMMRSNTITFWPHSKHARPAENHTHLSLHEISKLE